eukprot:gnl/TRDRNA2_/TRDRNA2_184676_c0_seq1.p1 gnl/TRDRNA2_/TRDRNA2_184676_c0~~gnl/TRDRNA2_/TRDRNA2_184676_c0_seq1.p1  ORF type:complete len:398 (+),score=71.43 gnl/TRDRNA2_/TRDRNA2_184676_c0_seq1:102-1196(+)
MAALPRQSRALWDRADGVTEEEIVSQYLGPAASRIVQQPAVQIMMRVGFMSKEMDELAAACRSGDVSKAAACLGVRKLSAQPDLIEVDLSFKRCNTPKAMETLFKAIPNTTTKLYIALKSCNLRTEGAKVVGQGLKALSALDELKIDVSYNGLGPEGLRYIMDSVPKSVTVFCAGLQSIRLGDEGAQVLAETLPPKVEDLCLDLNLCQLGDTGCVTIAHSLPKTIGRLALYLEGNNISDKGFLVWDRLLENKDAPEFGGHYLPLLKQEEFFKYCSGPTVGKYGIDTFGNMYEQYSHLCPSHKTERPLESHCLAPSPYAPKEPPSWWKGRMEKSQKEYDAQVAKQNAYWETKAKAWAEAAPVRAH